MSELLPPAAPPPAPHRRRGPLAALVAGALALALAVVAVAVVSRPLAVLKRLAGLTEEKVETVVLATLAQEAEASFLVTGTLTFTTSVEQTNTRTLLPGLLDVEVGTVRATVRMPARVAYGFDVRALRPADVRLAPDGVVEVDLPDLAVFSVEPELERAEIRTERGLLRLDADARTRVTQGALAEVRPALRGQAERHLARAEQPRLNAARAVVAMLAAPLRAAGLERPRFRVRLGGGAVLELDAPEAARGLRLDPPAGG